MALRKYQNITGLLRTTKIRRGNYKGKVIGRFPVTLGFYGRLRRG